MPLNLSIPLTTINADSSRTFGPYTVQAGDTVATLAIDRGVANGFDANPAASADITLQYSTDGGSTWLLLADAGIPGGPIFFSDKQGVQHQFTQSTVRVGIVVAVGFPSRALVTLHGGPVAVSGSFTVT